ncbi:hypothetical protein [Streptomyces sp. DH8]|uniref:hypothetical protein n=1 Tax=Streptomyces sp. DH8 TaxID=2857008 RepID=UPI001E41E147|nr:hypothetical protein [Streptomyces sp. DH8]
MTLVPRPILTDGATHPAQQFRNLVSDLARDNEGVTRGTDLKVTQLSTPGSSVQVSSGTGLVRGRYTAYQGTYAVMNVGSTNVAIAPTGGSPRSDMLIIRVEDKEYEGNIDPTSGEVNYFQVISNVSSSATTIPDGRTGIPLARIDIPASTSTITNAMIKDIRQIANPRRERRVWTQAVTTTSTELGASTTYAHFSTAAGWNIPIPPWASAATILVTGSALKLTANPFYGGFRATFGASLILQNVTIDDQGSGTRRTQSVAADTLTIPDAYRGTTQLLRAQAAAYSGNTGRISVDASTTLIADVEFTEAAR